MDGRPTWTDCEEAGDYVVSNVLSPRDLVSRPDIMDETVPHTCISKPILKYDTLFMAFTAIPVFNPPKVTTWRFVYFFYNQEILLKIHC